MLGWEAEKQTGQLFNLVSSAEEVCLAADKAKSFKGKCNETKQLVTRLSRMLKTLLCCIRSAPTPLYLHPVKSIVADVKAHVDLALSIVLKCKSRNLIRRLFTGRNTKRFVEKEMEIVIMKEMVLTILDRLSRSSGIWDQIKATDLVAWIAEHDSKLKEYHLIIENVIWRLVSLLSSANDRWPSSVQLQLKLSCSKALLMLVRKSLQNCTTLTETKGMLFLAKLLATEKDELQYNCLMIIREITAIAELNQDFRHSTFKSSSPASKTVVDELLKVIKEHDNTKLRITAIKSVGSLARSFSAKDIQVISPLVARLDDTDRQVAMEASIALQKFVCETNHLSPVHSKSIIEFNGVPLLVKILLEDRDKILQSLGLTLICNLAKHDNNIKVLINAGALTALQTTGQAIAEEQPELEPLVSAAISKLQSSKTEKHQVLDNSPGIKQFITEQSKVFLDFVRRPLKLQFEESCIKGISGAIRCLKTRSFMIMKAKCLKLGLTLRWVMKEIARKLRLVKTIVKSMEKKEIRRKFGYVVHKTRAGNRIDSGELFQAQMFLSSELYGMGLLLDSSFLNSGLIELRFIRVQVFRVLVILYLNPNLLHFDVIRVDYLSIH